MLVRSATVEVTDPVLLAQIERVERMRRDHKTVRNYRAAFRWIQELLDDAGCTAAEAEPWMWEEWFAASSLARGTRAERLSKLRAAYKYAVRRGMMESDPTFLVELERLPDEEPVVIPNHELREMKAALWEARGILAFHLLAYTGARFNEIRLLRWEEIDFASGTIRILGKGGKLRQVPVHPALGEELAHYREAEGYIIAPTRKAHQGSPVAEGTFRSLIAEFAGEYKPHDFRRTVASSLAYNGVADPVIDKIMGWAPRSVGRRYYIRVAGPELQRAILKLYGDDPV